MSIVHEQSVGCKTDLDSIKYMQACAVLDFTEDSVEFLVSYYVFFFQAEDGIRDFCLSRGLGDVYKRQDYWGI